MPELVRSYFLDVPEDDLNDLNVRLERTRWPTLEIHSDWATGVDLHSMRKIRDYWLYEYDWRKIESDLNKIPQFQFVVDGVNIHFFHIRAKNGSGRPLLLLHGWPGSQIEFLNLIDPLSAAFDLVIPALPGFGFSGKPSDSGWAPSRIADAMATLMTDGLGYQTFDVQGGDWGSIIGRRISLRHPTKVRSLHINMPYAFPADHADIPPYWKAFRREGTGYLSLQSTKPDSISIGNADSPMGLANWILEKFAAWSDCRGDLLSHMSLEQLVTNLMWYWLPNSAASAARIYLEAVADDLAPFRDGKVDVPTGVAVFRAEPYQAPREWVEAICNVQRWSEFESGGHFAALERPEELASDMMAFFATV